MMITPVMFNSTFFSLSPCIKNSFVKKILYFPIIKSLFISYQL
jgi:hypothetical protein